MFKYKLESLINHRIFIEKTVQKELALYQKLLDDEKNKLKEFIKEKTRYIKIQETQQKKRIKISDNIIIFNYLENISIKIDNQIKKVKDVQKKYDQKNSDLIEAMHNRKILDKLKEKGYKAYKDEINKNEIQFCDEIAVSRFYRKPF